MSNATYDKIKTASLLILPAVTFLAALVDIWGIPYGQQLVATLAAIDSLTGAAVAILAAQYHKQQEDTEEGSDG